MAKTELGWHFLNELGRLRYRKKGKYSSQLDDNKLTQGKLVVPGKTLRIKERPVPCSSGFHASKRIIQAYQFVQNKLCRVEVGGEIRHNSDKFCGQTRKAWWIRDVHPLVKEFHDSFLTEPYYGVKRVLGNYEKDFIKWLWKEKRLPTTRKQYEIYKKEQRRLKRELQNKSEHQVAG